MRKKVTGYFIKLYNSVKVSLFALILSLVIGSILITASGHNVWEAYGALLQGSLGSWPSFFGVVNKATPLILTGLAVSVAYTCNMLNIGGEGQLLMGALFGSVIGIYVKVPSMIHIPLVILAGMAGGAIWTLVPAFLRLKKGVGTVITTIMMNYIAQYFVQFVLSGPLKVPGEIYATDFIQESAKMPLLIGPPYRLVSDVVIAVACVFGIHFMMRKTVLGYDIKAVGENVHASKYAGIKVNRNMILALVISGSLCGLAGATQISGTLFRLTDGYAPGYGFTGIPIALMAGLNPVGIVFSAFLFATLRMGAISMQAMVGVPASIVDAMQGIIIFFICIQYIYKEYGQKLKKRLPMRKEGKVC